MKKPLILWIFSLALNLCAADSTVSRPAQPPARSAITRDGPVGLFFMTRFWGATGSLEQMVWYFDSDGQVYQKPGGSFTPDALARDSARKGRFSLRGEKLKATWSDGKVSESNYKVDGKGTGFFWDAGVFSAVPPPDWSKVSGYFEGGSSFSMGAGGATSVSGLTLRADGTFSWSRSASLRGSTSASEVTAGAAGGPREGRWKGEGYELVLTPNHGKAERYVAFPTPDPKDRSKVGMLFFNGTMHLPKPR